MGYTGVVSSNISINKKTNVETEFPYETLKQNSYSQQIKVNMSQRVTK